MEWGRYQSRVAAGRVCKSMAWCMKIHPGVYQYTLVCVIVFAIIFVTF